MRAHIDAVKAMLSPLGWPVFFVDVGEKPSYPYVLLWGSGGLPVADTLCGADKALSGSLGVTVVAATPESVLTCQGRVRALLNKKKPVVSGRSADPLRLYDSRPVDVDRTIAIPVSNRYPAFGVDMYHLSSTPA